MEVAMKEEVKAMEAAMEMKEEMKAMEAADAESRAYESAKRAWDDAAAEASSMAKRLCQRGESEEDEKEFEKEEEEEEEEEETEPEDSWITALMM